MSQTEEHQAREQEPIALEDKAIPGAEVFAQHLLHDSEYFPPPPPLKKQEPLMGKELKNQQSSSPRCVKMMQPQKHPSSPRHIKDNLKLVPVVRKDEASAAVFPKHLLHEEEYEDGAMQDDIIDEATATTFAKHLPHDKEYPRMETNKPRSNRHLKDQFVPEVTSQHQSSKGSTVLLVSPIPKSLESQDQNAVDEASTQSVANSQDFASLGSSLSAAIYQSAPKESIVVAAPAAAPASHSLSYAGHLKHPRLLEAQKQNLGLDGSGPHEETTKRHSFPFPTHPEAPFLSMMGSMPHVKNP